MGIILALLPLSLLLALCGLGGYYWAMRNRQMEDLETPRYRMLLDDPPVDDPQVADRTVRRQSGGITPTSKTPRD